MILPKYYIILLVSISISISISIRYASANDGVFYSLEDDNIKVLPLNPRVIKSSNQVDLISVYVSDSSFDMKSLKISPAISWSFNDEDVKYINKIKDGLNKKKVSNWPILNYTFIPYFIDEDGELTYLSRSESMGANIGSSVLLNIDYQDLDEDILKDLLHNPRRIGVIFLYEVAYSSEGEKLDNLNWYRDFLKDMPNFGLIEVNSAVELIYNKLYKSYVLERKVDPLTLQKSIEKIVFSSPIRFEMKNDKVKAFHDLSATLIIEPPQVEKKKIVKKTMVQGILEFGSLCDENESTIFISSHDGEYIGCDALE
ncbi:TPA: hypothetical protein ACN30P_004853 [Vibrio parahaemolyticus]